MARRSLTTAVLLIGIVAPLPALACGDGEAPTPCGETGQEAGAKWMLQRVTSAVQADRTVALDKFTKGSDGFRTADTYVFCIGADGVMSAHPNPILRGHDVRDLHDRTGNYFIRTMLQTARAGQVSEIHYLFPKPGSTVEEPKTTYYTKAGDQTCAVGVYDADTAGPAETTPDGRVAQLRQKLDGEIPASARADWTAFLEALAAQSDARSAAVAQARRDLRAAASALGAVEPRAGVAQE
ncbi:cache domain-containing protein [Methylobacterium sp. JK268]